MKKIPQIPKPLLPVFLALWGLTALPAEEPEVKPHLEDYLRFTEDADAGLLQTAVVSYENEAGVRVHVVGAVHIADAEYFAELNREFTDYDALLFEMVGGRDGIKKEDMEGTGPLHMLQGLMGKTLDLDFQLEKIDYEADNFVHADMDFETFAKKMAGQKLNLFALMMKVSEWERKQALERAKKGIKEPELGMAQVLKALLLGGGSDLKLVVGKQFGELNSLLTELSEEAAVIIGERNEVALKVMDREIKAGKKNLGIFYGAAHLPDMESRLIKRGFKRTGAEWRTAWFIPKKDGVKRPAAKVEEKADEEAEATAEQ